MQKYAKLLLQKPGAVAILKGDPSHPALHGIVRFFQTEDGVLVVCEITGLPHDTGACNSKVFGFHIHEGSACTGTPENPFENTGSHYNPSDCAHPHHAGDLPPLFENHGIAFLAFLTDRFSVDAVLSKTVVIHSQPDDFVTQPAGNAGTKIACGKIKRSFFAG